MASIIDIKLPRALAAALRIPPNDPRRQQIRVLKKLLQIEFLFCVERLSENIPTKQAQTV